MITLVADIITKLLKAESRLRYIKVSSDSTTITRLGYTESNIEMSNGGFAFTVYENVVIVLKPNVELFAVSTGTPNLSIAEAYNPHDAIVLG